MNRRALYYALLYAAAAITFKLIILLGGYYNTTFGWYFSHITSVVLIIPFYILAIRAVRDDNGGIIGGREAMRVSLTVFAVGVLLVSVYNYAEFAWKGQEMAEQYYHSEQYLNFLKKQSRIKPEQYNQIIAGQISTVPGSPFKATTGKLFSFLILGLSSAFICSATMKRSAR